MMAKDSVKSRIDKGISFTEFSYQIIQAWDFEHLYKNYNCTLQIGGQDQWGNITSGSELIRRKHGADVKVYGLTFPLVTKTDGTKFGKTESGAIWLDPEKTSPYEFYQFWINTSDADVLTRLKQFTFLPKEEIDKIEESLINEPEKRLAQMTLANEVVKLVHGKDALQKAINVSEALFSGNIKSLDVDEIEMGFKHLPSISIEDKMNVLDALIELKLVSSKRQAREMVKNNAVSINGDKVTDTYFDIDKENAFGHKYTIVRKGKKKYGMIKHK
jgi:tyrosyl-tRNA synthetase